MSMYTTEALCGTKCSNCLDVACPSNTTSSNYPVYNVNSDKMTDEEIATKACDYLVRRRENHNTAYKSGANTVFVRIGCGEAVFELNERTTNGWKFISKTTLSLTPSIVLSLMKKIKTFKAYAIMLVK
jgi:hypothetical protein